MFNDRNQISSIHNEQDGPEYRALWDPTDKLHSGRSICTTTDVLSSASQVGLKPLESNAVDAKTSRSLCSRMSWSTVSNAAERSKRTSAAKSPRSTARRMSESTEKNSSFSGVARTETRQLSEVGWQWPSNDEVGELPVAAIASTIPSDVNQTANGH